MSLIAACVIWFTGVTSAKEDASITAPQQGVELLFPAGTGKQAKDSKLSKEQKKAASLLEKLKAIEKGGDVNAVDKHGQTALMHAAAQDNRLAVCWLVAKGADASLKSKKGKTASSVAHGDMREFLTALEKEKQPLSRQEARNMYAEYHASPGEIERFSSSSGADAILMLRWAKANELSKLKNKEWEVDWDMRDPMKPALLYRFGARKFSFPEDISKVDAEPLQLLRALGVKTDKFDPVLQMRIALQLKQKETALALLKKEQALLQNSDIFSSIPDAKTLQALLNAGLDAKNEKLMEEVINKGDGAMLRTLLKAGAPLQDPDKILEKATKKDDENNTSASFILALIDAGAKADVNALPVVVSSEALGHNVLGVDIYYNDQAVAYRNSATLLHQAANEVDLPDVKLLLARGANPNIPGKKAKDDQEEPYGMTPLMATTSSAMRKNATYRTEIVKRLLDAGADVHAKDSAGNGVIYYAVCGGSIGTVNKKAEADILRMVELLLKAGADVPKDILARGALRPEISPAGRENLALMLLDAGADPLAKSESGKTSLMVNGIGVPKIAERLLDAGADVHAKDSEGKGVIYYVIYGEDHGEEGMCGTFTEEGEPVSGSKREETDILRMVELLLKAGADVPKDILAQELPEEISPAGREKLALMLLDAGADPLAKGENTGTTGWTTLMVNGICGPKIAKRLLDSGVDPTVKCGETSAMSLAMKEGAVEIVELLKEKGIDPGELQLMDSETEKFMDPEKIEPLLKLGARIPKDMTERLMDEAVSIHGHIWSPARLCEDYVDIIQILKKHGFKPELMAWAKKSHSNDRTFNTNALDAFFKTGSNPNEIDENANSLLANVVASADEHEYMIVRIAGALPAFIEAGVDVNKPLNQDGQPPLFYAKDAETIAQLLRVGADAHVRDAKGRTPLFPCHFSRDADAVRLLMQRGVRINAQDNEGNTALMMAVTKDSSGVQVLLDAGADPNIKNKAGKTALQIAQENKAEVYRNKIVKLLQEHGAKE